MQFTTVVAFIATVAAVAVAQNCNTGDMQCCQNTQHMSSISKADIFSIAAQGLSLVGSNGQVGSACSPLLPDAVSGAVSCSAQAVCCDQTSMNGFFAVGCTPLNLS